MFFAVADWRQGGLITLERVGVCCRIVRKCTTLVLNAFLRRVFPDGLRRPKAKNRHSTWEPGQPAKASGVLVSCSTHCDETGLLYDGEEPRAVQQCQ